MTLERVTIETIFTSQVYDKLVSYAGKNPLTLRNNIIQCWILSYLSLTPDKVHCNLLNTIGAQNHSLLFLYLSDPYSSV